MSIRIQKDPFQPAKELASFTTHNTGVGAVVSCTGLVRATSASDGDVTALELQHYPGFTEREMGRFETDARERFAVTAISIIHRHGYMRPGEAIVFVAVASAHRRAALEAVDYLMDRLKTEAPFWKKEITTQGDHWIEPRTDDHTDRARWDGHDAK